MRGDLLRGLIKHLSWRCSRVKKRNIRPIGRPLCAIDAAHRHDFVVSLGILVACERRRRIEKIVTDARDAERSYVLPLESDPRRDTIHNWTTWCCLPFSR